MKITTKKCVFILPYFGKFNNYFPLFLKSCEKNPTYNWLIFTDCKEKYNYPENVDVVDMTLQELKKKAEDLDFKFQWKHRINCVIINRVMDFCLKSIYKNMNIGGIVIVI